MSAFFRNMNLARGIILLAVLGSLFLFWRNREDRKTLEFLEESLETTVPKTVEQIQLLSQQYSKLVQHKESEGLSRSTSPETYFDKQKDLDGANLGFLDYSPSTSNYDRGIEDQNYRIKPSDKDAAYRREQIAYFMWQLEAGSNRLKVTDIDIQLANRRGLKDYDVPEDKWTFSLQTTTRQEEVDG